jgi:hypothetical protein
MSGSTPRGPKGGKIRPGDPIRARFLNDTRDLAERSIGLAGGVVGTTLDGRTTIRATGRGGVLVKTPAGGINAAVVASNAITAGSAECTLYQPTNTGWDLTSVSVTVYNTFTAAVAGSTICQAKPVDGRLVVDVEPC